MKHLFSLPMKHLFAESALLLSIVPGSAAAAQVAQYEDLMQDVVIAADLWSAQPEILSAAFGFEGIIGVAPFEFAVRAAGGTWIQMPPGTSQPPLRSLTSAAPVPAVPIIFGTNATQTDAMPIVFSWPVLPSTVQPSDFLVHLSDGTSVSPAGVSIAPCQEFNERNVAVLVGELGNRLVSGEAGAIYPVQVDIVDDGSPLMLIGPGGALHSAVGLSKASSNPYELDNGPTLVGAKLTPMSVEGEGAPAQFPAPVNDGVALYGADAQFRLRVLTTGGFSPNGVTGVTPDQFSSFFRLLVNDGGTTTILTQTGVDYVIPEGTIRIVGLADLGLLQSSYDLTYTEDYDNYIDIILKGDEAAMREILAVEIPAAAGYQRFYNPGGPGNDPTPGVRYTQPGPADIEPVLIAIDDPFTTTFVRPSTGIGLIYCSPGVNNSTGLSGRMRADGSATVTDQDVTISALDLPTSSFGFFITSQQAGFTFPVSNSEGALCVTGSIGRYVGPGQIQNSGTAGEFSLALDLNAVPSPTGFLSVAPGDTWHFQAWHRDALGGQTTSNFTDAVAVTFQ